MLVTHGVLSACHPAVLLNALDLHPRAADQFVRLAGQLMSEIRASYDGRLPEKAREKAQIRGALE